MTTHTNTAGRVLAIDRQKMTVDLLFVRAFVFGKPILYLSSEASDPATAAIERAIYVLALSFSSFSGGGGIPDKSARAEIFATANGVLRNPSPPGHSLAHVIVSGANTIDANLQNGLVSEALPNGGDAHNILDEWPVANPVQAHSRLRSALGPANRGVHAGCGSRGGAMAPSLMPMNFVSCRCTRS